MPRLAGIALAALAAAGCLQSPFAAPPTTLEVACAVLDPGAARAVAIRSLADPRLSYHPIATGQAVREALAKATGRPLEDFVLETGAGPLPDGTRWNRTSLADWADGQAAFDGGTVRLTILWVDGIGDDNATGALPAPGVVVLAMQAVHAGARRLEAPVERVALAVALHHIGHALGQVNDGIPVQARDIQEREDPARHDRDPASVLHAGWEDARTMVWAPNATYDAYPASSLADWRGALAPGGVCA